MRYQCKHAPEIDQIKSFLEESDLTWNNQTFIKNMVEIKVTESEARLLLEVASVVVATF